MSEKPTIHEALSSVMGDVQSVRKGDRNTEQGYNFRGIDSVVNAVGPALRAHRVVILPRVLKVQYRDVLTNRGKPSRECTVKVRYRFTGPAGDHLDVVTVGEAMDFGDKGTPKAMSVALRVALLQALCIPTDEPDADHATYERAQDTRREDEERAQARTNWLANCRPAIEAAADREACAVISQRIDEAGERGIITADDSIALRRLLVARLDVLYPNAQHAEASP